MSQRRLSYTMLSTFLTCRTKYFWSYVQRRRPTVVAQPLQLGSAGHKAMASWYKEQNEDMAITAAWETLWQYNPDSDGQDEDWLQLLAALQRYFPWSRSNDTWKVRALDEHLVVPIPGTSWALQGYLDMIVEEEDGLWVLDHKFSSRATPPPMLDLQTYLYGWLMAKSGRPCTGSIYNIVRLGTKIAEKEPCARGKIQGSSASYGLLETELRRQVQQIEQAEWDGCWYRSLSPDCTWSCNFFPACNAIQAGGDWRGVLDAICPISKEESPHD